MSKKINIMVAADLGYLYPAQVLFTSRRAYRCIFFVFGNIID